MARSDEADWLLEGEPWVRYRTRVDLPGQSEKDIDVRAARRELLAHPLVKRLLAELSRWPGPALKSHKDASTILHALLSFGLEKIPRVGEALCHLLALVRENGWPCAVSPSLGKFRGPGRCGDPCPYATLLMLKVLSAIVAAQADANGRFTAQSRVG